MLITIVGPQEDRKHSIAQILCEKFLQMGLEVEVLNEPKGLVKTTDLREIIGDSRAAEEMRIAETMNYLKACELAGPKFSGKDKVGIMIRNQVIDERYVVTTSDFHWQFGVPYDQVLTDEEIVSKSLRALEGIFLFSKTPERES